MHFTKMRHWNPGKSEEVLQTFLSNIQNDFLFVNVIPK